MKRLRERFVLWAVSLMRDEDKYILLRSLQDRVEALEHILVKEKWVDPNGVKDEIDDTEKLIKKLNLSTSLWK